MLCLLIISLTTLCQHVQFAGRFVADQFDVLILTVHTAVPVVGHMVRYQSLLSHCMKDAFRLSNETHKLSTPRQNRHLMQGNNYNDDSRESQII